MDKESCQQEIEELINKYNNLPPQIIKHYNEENTKKDFILPLFKLLGWDTENYSEVAAEEKASGKRVDYAFKIDGVSRFYLEAKSLRTDIFHPEFIKQAITYAYNKGVSWAVLTNFENLLVFYALAETKDFNRARHISLTCKDYIDNFEKLYLLSKEATVVGLLNVEAEKTGLMPLKRPPTVDKKLFAQLREWREELFSQLLHHDQPFNPIDQDINISLQNIDEVIQRLFNRLIFIRTCEDRKIEDNLLLSMINQWHDRRGKGELINSLRELFHLYNEYYDSDLFTNHMLDEAFIEAPVIDTIIRGLYDVPGGLAAYDFSVIDADVLGQVYEQYLGYVAIAARQRADVIQRKLDLGLVTTTIELELKRQKRKESGIYYTPKWVVDYIVQQTVGYVLKEKYHNDILHLKILDPACGSGSFLIRAYDEILNYHAEQAGKSVIDIDLYQRLSILTSNIFGVDLDYQAVEIARLNLLLRALAQRFKLPFLASTIKQGNSLISGDQKGLETYFGDDWEHKHIFNWEKEFSSIIENGGFDIIIGNPPYVRIQTLPSDEVNYFKDSYESAWGSFDVYILFIERALKLLKDDGRLGFITSGKFLKAEYGKKLQEVIRREANIESIVDLSAHQIFGKATTYPIILLAKKCVSNKYLTYIDVPTSTNLPGLNEHFDISKLPVIKTSQNSINKGLWPPPIGIEAELLNRLDRCGDKLGIVATTIGQGLKTGADKVFVVSVVAENGKNTEVFSESLGRKVKLESSMLLPIAKIEHIRRYALMPTNLRVIFPYNKRKLFDEITMQSKYGKTWEYLLANKKILDHRDRGNSGTIYKWYAFSRNQALDIIRCRKLLTPDASPYASFCYDYQGEYAFSGGFAGGYALTFNVLENDTYFLGLVNSKLFDFCLRSRSTSFRGGYFSYESRYIKNIPIRRINMSNRADLDIHDKVVNLVNRMLELKKRIVSKGIIHDSEREDLEKEVNQIDHGIDILVYDLYELTKKEIIIIENNSLKS